MKWEDVSKFKLRDKDCVKTDVECPECGALLVRFTGVVLASYPPKYRYECRECGFVGTNY